MSGHNNNPYSEYGTGFQYGTGYTYVSCKHINNAYWRPFDKDKTGGNILIAGSSNFDAVADCDLIVNLHTTPVSAYKPPLPPKDTITCSDESMVELFKEFNAPPPAPKKTIVKTPKTITIDWPDYGIPNLAAPFWERLFQYVLDMPVVPGSETIEVLFTCQGGNGRTGTAMCCFLIGSGAYDPLEAIKHVRSGYCGKAVESQKQEDYIWRVGAWFLKREGHDEQAIMKLKNKYEDWIDDFTKPSGKKKDFPPSDKKTAALLGYPDTSRALDALDKLYE